MEAKPNLLPDYVKVTILLLGGVLFFVALYFASSILIPLALAAIISIILYPITRRMEIWGFPRVMAILISIILIFLVLAGLIALLSSQVFRFTDDIPTLTEEIGERFHEIQDLINDLVHVPPTEQIEWVREQAQGLLASSGSFIRTTLGATTNVFAVLGLLPIYIFFFLYYRTKFKQFIFMISPQEKHRKAQDILDRIKDVVQSYISGLMIVILIMAILNTVGLTILGIRYALFFGVLAALLTVIPFIGIFIGSALPILMALLTKDSIWYAVGVLAIFAFVQFLEGNFITPNIVGRKVSINPLMAILALVVGGAVWGIVGMIIAIPLLGVLKVVLDNVEALRPYGFLLGTEGVEETGSWSRLWRSIKAIFH